MKTNRFCRWELIAVIGLLVVAGGGSHAAQQLNEVSLRETLEGTWVLEEWHFDGEVLRPPVIGGRWTLHDGVVMANFHRNSGGSYESFSAYGRYEIDGDKWSYGYERVQTTYGRNPDDATVSVQRGLQMQSFSIRVDEGMLILERPNDRREYEGRSFRFMPDGSLLRHYRKVE